MSAKGLLVIVASFTLGFASDAYASKAVHVSCGETITKNTRLANDLTDCPNNGLVIGADDITLDLNGHTIDGDGPGDDEYDLGIDNTAGHDGVTIEHGSVREFVEGVLIVGARDNRLRELSTSHDEHGGIYIGESTDIRVEGSSSMADCAGVIVEGSRKVLVARNSVSGQTCAAIPVFSSERVRIAGNTVSGNEDLGHIDAAGIGLFDGSHHNRIERNSVSGSGWAAVTVEHGDDNEVTGNHIFRNNAGVILDGHRNTISRNRVSDVLGDCDGCGFGISFEGGHDNLIADNTVERTREAGILLAAFEPFTPPAVDNAARSNTVRDAQLDGILVEATAPGTLLDRNSATGNGDDGIDVDSEATRLVGNTANHNDDLGIEAVAGVTDGGGNRASGNGNPLQCSNVFCK